MAEGTLAGSRPAAELSPEGHCAKTHQLFTSPTPKLTLKKMPRRKT